MTIIVLILILGVLVFVHELGHFLFAKLFGVYCIEFSLGMGPLVTSKKFKKDKEILLNLFQKKKCDYDIILTTSLIDVGVELYLDYKPIVFLHSFDL